MVNGPTVQGNNLAGTPVQNINDNQDTVEVDWVINPKNSLFFRETWQNAPLIPASLIPFGGQQTPSAGSNQVAQLTTLITPTVVNVARIYHSYALLFGQQVPVDRKSRLKSALRASQHSTAGLSLAISARLKHGIQHLPAHVLRVCAGRLEGK